jgi:hypothetical protein
MACGIVVADTVNNFYLKAVEIMNKDNIKIFLFVVLALISIIVVQSLIWINVGP